MSILLSKLTNKKKSSASVVDGKLILSFPEAITPVVWQMDLNKAKASALEVQERKGGYTLVLKTPKGENLEIAPFDNRKKAVDGLIAASHALQNAYGQINPQGISNENTPSFSYPNQAKKKKIFPILASILVLFFLYWIWSAISLQNIDGYQTTNVQNTSDASKAAQSSGVAVSADDFLMGR